MSHVKLSLIKFIIVVLAALVFFIGTSLIPRQGHYVANAAIVGDATHRDNRGMPFIFLKRSLADGECEVANERSTTCLRVSKTFVGQSQHEISYVYLLIDIIFWVLLSAALLNAYNVKRRNVLNHKHT